MQLHKAISNRYYRSKYFDTKRIRLQKFYVCKNPLTLPVRRQLNLQVVLNDMELNVTNHQLDAFQEMMHDLLQKGNVPEARRAVDSLKAYRELYTTNELMFRLANCITLMAGEPWNDFHPDYTEKKRKLYENNQNVKAFFLRTSLASLKILIASSTNINVVDYLNSTSTKIIERIFLSLIEDSTSTPTSKR